MSARCLEENPPKITLDIEQVVQRHKWRILKKTIPVVNTWRDLGMHLSTGTAKRVATTLTERMVATKKSVEKLGMIKAPYAMKTKAIRMKLLPKALYGSEAAPVNESALRRLRSAIADTITFTTARRAVDLTYATCSNGRDLDLDIEIVCRRVAAVRRALSKGGSMKRQIEADDWKVVKRCIS